MNEQEEIIKIINSMDANKKKELAEKISTAKSAKEFIETVNNNGFNISNEMGEKLYALMNKEKKMSESELKEIAAGMPDYYWPWEGNYTCY